MFDTVPRLLLGLLTGFIFGFLLQKGRVSRFSVIVGQFLLRDFTMMKVMMTAIVVGGAGVYAMSSMGWVSLSIKPALMGAVIVGSLIFGVAMVVLGYCPGTAVAAAAEGNRDALAGLFGMLVGAGVYAEVFPALKTTILNWSDLGKVTLPDTTGTPWWLWFLLLGAGAILFFGWLDRKGLDGGARASASGD